MSLIARAYGPHGVAPTPFRIDYSNISKRSKQAWNMFRDARNLYRAQTYDKDWRMRQDDDSKSKNNSSYKMPRRPSYRKGGAMRPATTKGHVSYSRGTVIGKAKRASFRSKVQAIFNPPTTIDQKFVFQMDCVSGRSTACTIPVLTDTMALPLFQQVFTNLTTDNSQEPTLSLSVIGAHQYSVKICNYRTSLSFLNSSSSAARCRLIWYKPRVDLEETLSAVATGLLGNPLNLLMWLSTVSQQTNPSTPTSVLGDGFVFDTLSAGSNYLLNYNHAGSTVTGASTTDVATTNQVAWLDPSLFPSNSNIAPVFNRFWSTAGSEEFSLGPGDQHNTSMSIRNKMFKRNTDNLTGNDVEYIKGSTLVGVLYVLGQIAFTDNATAPVASGYQVSTSNTQISCIRTDRCTLIPDVTRRAKRVNFHFPFPKIAEADEAIVNFQSGDVDTNFTRD